MMNCNETRYPLSTSRCADIFCVAQFIVCRELCPLGQLLALVAIRKGDWSTSAETVLVMDCHTLPVCSLDYVTQAR